MGKTVANLAAKAQKAQEDETLDLNTLLSGEELNPALEQLYAELGGDSLSSVKVYIYKLDEKTGKEPRIWQGPPGDYDLWSIAKRFGSGDYRIKVMGPMDDGRIVIRANQIVPMLLDPVEDQRIEAMRKGELIAPSVQQTNNSMTPETISKMIVDGIRAAMPAPVQQPDPFALFAKMSDAMKNLMPQQPQGGGLSGMRDTLDLIRAVNEMRGDAPERGSKRGFEDVGLSVVEKLLNKHLEGNAASTALPAPKQEQAQVERQLSPEEIEQVKTMQMAMRVILLEAQSGSDPKEVADKYFENIPDQVFVDLYNNPKWFEILCENEPRFRQYSEWCNKLRTALIEFAQEEGLLTANGQLVQNQGDATDKGNVTAGDGGQPAG